MASPRPTRKPAVAISPEIPDKLYFRIGDVARLCGLAPYVLRFWETEFPQLRPNKGGTGQRLYRRRDVEIVLRIKRLLYDEGYTIPGARQALRLDGARPDSHAETPAAPAAAPLPPPATTTDRHARLRQLQQELQQLAAELAAEAPAPGSPLAARPTLTHPAATPPTATEPLDLRQQGLFPED